MSNLDMETIRYALKTAKKYGLREISLAEGDVHFKSKLSTLNTPFQKKESSAQVQKPCLSSEKKEGQQEDVIELFAAMVGYYQSLTGMLEAGQVIHKGDVLAHIITLGLPNEVISPVEGEVLEVYVHDFEPVEYNQVLARIRLI